MEFGGGRYVNVIDHHFVWQTVNDDYAALLGYRRRRDLIGRSAWSASAKVDNEREAATDELARTGLLSGLSTIVTRRGEQIPFSFTTRALNGGEFYVTVGEVALPLIIGQKRPVSANSLNGQDRSITTRSLTTIADTTLTLGQRLLWARTRKGLSRAALAAAIGSPGGSGTIGRLERDEIKRPHADTIHRIALVLDVDPGWLYTGHGEP